MKKNRKRTKQVRKAAGSPPSSHGDADQSHEDRSPLSRLWIIETDIKDNLAPRFRVHPRNREVAELVRHIRYLCRDLPDGWDDHPARMVLRELCQRPNLFRLIADELERSKKLDDDSRRSKIVSAYWNAALQKDEAGAPEFGQVRFFFDSKWGKGLDVSDYSMRKTLRSLRLPLAPAKPGRRPKK
jgi:hypothetical protein